MSIGSKAILIVDVESDQAVHMKGFLEKYGGAVSVFSSGEDAVEHVLRNHVDLVLMGMDGGAGTEGLEAIRRTIGEKNIPMVFIVSSLHSQTVRRVDSIASYGYIVKGSNDILVLVAIQMALRVAEKNCQLETLLQRTKAKSDTLRQLIRGVPASVAVFDRDMRYLAVSDRFYSDYGLPDRDLIGKSHYEVFPEIRDCVKAMHRACLEGQSASDEFSRFRRGNGAIDFVQWKIEPWVDENGEIGGLILFSVVLNKALSEYQKIFAETQP